MVNSKFETDQISHFTRISIENLLAAIILGVWCSCGDVKEEKYMKESFVLGFCSQDSHQSSETLSYTIGTASNRTDNYVYFNAYE